LQRRRARLTTIMQSRRDGTPSRLLFPAALVCLLTALLDTSPATSSTPSYAPRATAAACATTPTPTPLAHSNQRTIRLGFQPVAMVVSERTGHVFVVGEDPCTGSGHLAMLDARSGAVLATLPLPRYPTQIASDEREHRLFVLAGWVYPGTVLFLDTHSGQIVRTVKLGYPLGRMAVAARAGRLFVASWGRRLFVLDARSGTQLHTVVGSGTLQRTLATNDRLGRVYAVWGARQLTLLAADTGQVIKRTTLGRCGGAYGVKELLSDAALGMLYTSSEGEPGKGGPGVAGYLCLVDARTGRVVRAISAGKGVSVDLVALDQRAAVILIAKRGYLAGGGPVLALNARNGQLRRRLGALAYAVYTGGPPQGDGPAPVVDPASGCIYALTMTLPHNLLAITPSSWQQRVVAYGVHGTILALASQEHRLFLAADDGTLTVLRIPQADHVGSCAANTDGQEDNTVVAGRRGARTLAVHNPALQRYRYCPAATCLLECSLKGKSEHGICTLQYSELRKLTRERRWASSDRSPSSSCTGWQHWASR
jgi:DNA-binding beta-propeller fold protein YncE